MTEKRFTTVELPKPNRWGIWYDGAYLSTYQVCILLNEYVDVKKEKEQLKKENNELKLLVQNWEALDEEKDEQLDKQNQALKKLKKENLDLSEELGYYKTKCASLETGLFQADKENNQLGLQNSTLMKEVAEYSRKAKELEKENEKLKQDRFICLDCKHSGYAEIGCLCEKKDHWTDYKSECEDYEELE